LSRIAHAVDDFQGHHFDIRNDLDMIQHMAFSDAEEPLRAGLGGHKRSTRPSVENRYTTPMKKL
jgi:hypothetical protein